jgi:rubrerythrin
MNNEEKILSMMEKMYIELQTVKKDMATKEEMQGTKEEVQKLSQQLTRMENTHGEKLTALFDGYKQHTDQLNRIEEKLSTHDEFIIKRIK